MKLLVTLIYVTIFCLQTSAQNDTQFSATDSICLRKGMAIAKMIKSNGLDTNYIELNTNFIVGFLPETDSAKSILRLIALQELQNLNIAITKTLLVAGDNEINIESELPLMKDQNLGRCNSTKIDIGKMEIPNVEHALVVGFKLKITANGTTEEFTIGKLRQKENK